MKLLLIGLLILGNGIIVSVSHAEGSEILPVLVALVSEDYEVKEPTCQNWRQVLEEYRKESIRNGELLSSFFHQFELIVTNWHETFSVYEGRVVVFPVGTFSALKVSADNMGLSSENLSFSSGYLDTLLYGVIEILPGCVEGEQNEERGALIKRLTRHNDEARRLETILYEAMDSGDTAGLKAIVKKWYHRMEPNEAKAVYYPETFFSRFDKLSQQVVGARALMNENFLYHQRRFDAIFTELTRED